MRGYVRVSMCMRERVHACWYPGTLPCTVGMAIQTVSPTHARTTSRPTSVATDGTMLVVFRAVLSSVRTVV